MPKVVVLGVVGEAAASKRKGWVVPVMVTAAVLATLCKTAVPSPTAHWLLPCPVVPESGVCVAMVSLVVSKRLLIAETVHATFAFAVDPPITTILEPTTTAVPCAMAADSVGPADHARVSVFKIWTVFCATPAAEKPPKT